MLFLPECCAFIGLNSAEASRDDLSTAVLAMLTMLDIVSYWSVPTDSGPSTASGWPADAAFPAAGERHRSYLSHLRSRRHNPVLQRVDLRQ